MGGPLATTAGSGQSNSRGFGVRSGVEPKKAGRSKAGFKLQPRPLTFGSYCANIGSVCNPVSLIRVIPTTPLISANPGAPLLHQGSWGKIQIESFWIQSENEPWTLPSSIRWHCRWTQTQGFGFSKVETYGHIQCREFSNGVYKFTIPIPIHEDGSEEEGVWDVLGSFVGYTVYCSRYSDFA